MTRARRLGMLHRVLVTRAVKVRLSLLSSLLLVAGCQSGTETGNPSITGLLSYTGYSSAELDVGVGVGRAGRVATVEAAWFALDSVIVSADGCAGRTAAFVAPALGIGDHAKGSHNSTAFAAEPGAFCTVELPFLPVPSGTNDVPAEVAGHAILLTGKLPSGVGFRIVSDRAPLIRLSAASAGFALEAERPDLLLAFDFATWLAELDFASAAVSDDGSIEISSTQNSELLAAFDAQVPRGVLLYRDRDADGVVDREPELLAQPR